MQHGPGMHMGSLKRKLASFEISLKNKKQIAEDTYEFTFGKPEGLHFSAGQHIRMTLIDPPETDAEGDKRFLTMASTPQESDLRFAMRMRNTAFKRSLGQMQPGGKVLIQKLVGESPHGSFVLHENIAKSAVFVAGGIGIVPAYAMIKDAIERKLPHTLFLFYCNRRPEDAPYLTDLQKLAKQNPNFKLIATMTEAGRSAQRWQGETGIINRALLEKHVRNLQNSTYYVSGLSGMVSSMQTMLKEAGVKENDIRAEEFTGFNLNETVNRPTRTWTNHLPLIALGLVLTGIAIVHVAGANSIFHSGIASFSINSPLSYLFVGTLLVVIAAKIKLLRMGFRHSIKRKKGLSNVDHEHHHHEDEAKKGSAMVHGQSLNRTAASATLHCLTGCAIGEALGMIISTALVWAALPSIALSVALAFLFGYLLSLRPLVKSGLPWKKALKIALAADTASITVMEITDNAVIMVIPGAIHAALTSSLFWGSLAFSLVVAFVVAFPLNKYLISRGKGHAVAHEYHH